MGLRSLLNSFKKKKNTAKAAVLMYHRVANLDSDPWELAVSLQNFEEQLQILQRYNVIGINDFQKLLNQKKDLNHSIVLTFDDGYLDNFVEARPLLKKYNLPTTFFITSATIGAKREFWWDALDRICLSISLPSQLSIKNPFNISLQLGVDYQTPFDLYLKLCDEMRKLNSQDQQMFMRELEEWSKNNIQRESYLPMTEVNLLDLMAENLFTIGAHTQTHPFLPNFPYKYQESEINNSISYLSQLSKKKIAYFAFPHGGRNQDSLSILEKSTIELSFTTEPRLVTNDTNRLEIPRFQVKNWDGKTFEKHLKNWLSYN